MTDKRRQQRREAQARYRARNPEKAQAARVAWNKNRTSEYNRNAALKRNYGITLADYNKLFEEQKGLCGICGKPGKLVVDHDHTTGKIRGLLHNNCNRALGFFLDNPTILRKAAEYIEHG